MSIISLITDFGLKDNFAGVIKAVIFKVNPRVQIVDICHEIRPQDVQRAAFLLKSSFRYFPPGTIHLVIVDPGVGSKRKKLLVKTKNYFFIAPDNGVLSLTLKEEIPRKIIEIANTKYFLRPLSDTFHGRDLFAPVAAHLSKAKDIHKFGEPINSFKELSLPKVKTTSKSLVGEIIYIDRFGNLVSNIDKDTLGNFISTTKHGGSANLSGGKNKKFKIYIKDRTIDRLSHSYLESTHLKPIVLINSFDYLEIAINGTSASKYLGVNIGAKIRIIRM